MLSLVMCGVNVFACLVPEAEHLFKLVDKKEDIGLLCPSSGSALPR